MAMVTVLMKVFDKKQYGHFAGPKKSVCNNKVTILPKWT